MSDTKERPIIFTADEVNAVLAGNKTQHRIPILTSEQVSAGYEWDFAADGDAAVFHKYANDGDSVEDTLLIDCPFGATGDRLWVQELHARTENEDLLTRTHYYAGSGDLRPDLRHDAGLLTKYDAADMPRWASRTLLEITDISIERMQDISESDALAMGLKPDYCDHKYQTCEDIGCIGKWAGALWLHLRHDKKLPVHHTAWVWVIEFKKVDD